MEHEAPFGIIYGAEGYDFPFVKERGPYASLEEATAALDHKLAKWHGGWTIVSGWEKSDGYSITTGKGRVVSEGGGTK